MNGTKINTAAIDGATNQVDAEGASTASYTVRAIKDGKELADSPVAKHLPQAYLEIPLQIPPGGKTPDGKSHTYSANDASAGDLDGDGQYEIVVKWYPSNAQDNAFAGYTGNTILDACNLDGKRLWRIDLGRNIRSGAHYTQFQVMDFDGDGKAEIACQTADGSRVSIRDLSGRFLSYATADRGRLEVERNLRPGAYLVSSVPSIEGKSNP